MPNDDPFIKNEKSQFWTNITNPAGISNTCANIVCFIVFQCIFFYFVASKQYDSLVLEKATFIETFLKNSPVAGRIMCTQMKKSADDMKNIIDVKAKERKEKNIKSLKSTAALFVIPAAIIALLSAGYAINKNKWTRSHTLALILIAGCFTTEFIIYIAVFRTHVILGDYELLLKIFDKMYPPKEEEEK